MWLCFRFPSPSSAKSFGARAGFDGKLIYMASVLGLWSAVLWAAHGHNAALASLLLGVVTMYHSVEYLALVSHYASLRRTSGSTGLFRTMAGHWVAVLSWYVVGCGLLYSFANSVAVTACFAVNMWASLVHCAFDGLMWRMRESNTARLFGTAAVPLTEGRE